MVTSATNVLFKQPKPIIVISPSAKGTTKVSEQLKHPYITHVIAPERSMGTSSPEPNKDDEPKNERRRMSRGKKIGFGVVGAVAGAALAVPLALGVANGNANNAGPEKDDRGTSGEAPANPGMEEEPTSPEVEQGGNNQTVEHDPIITPENDDAILESLRIKADATPEQAAEKINEILTRWGMAGATPELIEINYDNTVNASGPRLEELAQQIAAQNAIIYAEALFGPNWNEQSEAVAAYTQVNADNLVRYMRTFGSDERPNTNTKNLEAYTESWSSETTLVGWSDAENTEDPTTGKYVERAKMVFGSDELLIVNFTSVRTNNAENNLYGDEETYAESNGKLFYSHAVLIPDDKGNYYMAYAKSSDQEFIGVDY